MEEDHEVVWQGYVDWKNKPALRTKHGGMLAASFVLVVEVMENLAFLANASNLVTYLTGFMHFSPSRAANTVTNFMGTCFLLALFGGFLSDAFSTSFRVYLLSALIEFFGLVILTVQAKSSTLKPPPCTATSGDDQCEQVSGSKAAMLFAGLYLAALGVGGIKGSLPAHGAEQFDDSTLQGRKHRSTFFNYFVFCLSSGGLIAVTFVVWVEDNKGWQWGFGISTITILLSIPVFLSGTCFYRIKIPIGSPLTTIAKVLAAAICNTANVTQSPSNAVIDMSTSPTLKKKHEQEEEEASIDHVLHTDHRRQTNSSPDCDGSMMMKFLDRASQGKPIHKSLVCTNAQVEDVKIVLKVLPIFLSTIMLSCCLAQLSTFSVQQAATMDTRLGGLTVPPASLPVFPVVFIMILAPIYDHIIMPFARKLRKTETGISHLQRIGIGLVFSIIAMGVAALVEMKRKRSVQKIGVDSSEHLPITFFWVAIQYLFLGSADLFTLAGLLEFFFTEAPEGMKSLATSLSWASLAMGYYLSSVLVAIVNHVTGAGAEHRPWLAGENLNHYHLDRFYWLMCALSTLNFMQYLFWATNYKYRSK